MKDQRTEVAPCRLPYSLPGFCNSLFSFFQVKLAGRFDFIKPAEKWQRSIGKDGHDPHLAEIPGCIGTEVLALAAAWVLNGCANIEHIPNAGVIETIDSARLKCAAARIVADILVSTVWAMVTLQHGHSSLLLF